MDLKKKENSEGPWIIRIIKAFLSVLIVLAITLFFYCYANHKFKFIRHEEVREYVYDSGKSYRAVVQDPTRLLFYDSWSSDVSKGDALIKARKRFDDLVFVVSMTSLGIIVLLGIIYALIERKYTKSEKSNS